MSIDYNLLGAEDYHLVTLAREHVYDIRTGRQPGDRLADVAATLDRMVDRMFDLHERADATDRLQADLEYNVERVEGRDSVLSDARNDIATLLANMAEDCQDDHLDWDEMVRGVAEKLAEIADNLNPDSLD